MMRADVRYVLSHPTFRSVGALAMVALATCAIAGLLWLDAHTSLAKAEHALESERRGLMQSRADAELSKAFLLAHDRVERAEERLHVRSAQARLVRALSDAAARHRVQVLSQAFEPERSQAGEIRRWAAELSLRGNYEALRGFLGEVADFPVWAEAAQVQIEVLDVSGSASNPMLHAKVVLALASKGDKGDGSASALEGAAK